MTRGSETEHQNRRSSRHSLFARHVSVICIFVMMFMSILTGCSSSTEQDKEAAGETGIIPIENETDGSADTAVIELTEDTNPDINELFTTYFADLAKGDVKALGKIMVKAPDKDTVAKESEYIEDYQNIKCYSKKGILDDTYVVYVYYEVKFKNIDTLAPSMIREYVCTNEDGALYINNGEVSGEVASWLEEVQTSDSAVSLINRVNEDLAKAASSDQKLYDLIAKLNEGAGTEETSAGETTAKKEEAETTKEETKKEETAKAETEKETTKEETSKEETTAKETTKAAETTAKETEYKAFDKKTTMYAQENLNIRKKASADSKLMGKLIAGDSVTALGTTGEWTVISYKGGKAYILSELLGKKKPDLGVSFKSVDETVEATQNVRMRKQPDANAEVVGTLPGGTKVKRTGYDSKWSKIVYDGKTVYVASEYLQK
ncbi:MAG: SH3 domain-containing protein [Lachnospiraceae bacterium]|nr:SH3 domain-containing protein [Lachnospiraceae bacterium]MDY4971913.1 SH3 domain-containing protein [Lachnospiraceae bacterium]